MPEDSTFEAFIREHQDLVFTTALRLLRNESDAEDVAQEVFLRAYRDYEMLRDNPSAGGWMRQVARNLCLNHLTRYRSRWKLFSDWFHSDDSEVDPDSIIPSDLNPADPDDSLALVQEALLTLPDKQRVPLVLFHYEEMSYLEIAAALKIPLSQVKTDIHRGREALKEKILRLRGQADRGFFPPRVTRPSAQAPAEFHSESRTEPLDSTATCSKLQMS